MVVVVVGVLVGAHLIAFGLRDRIRLLFLLRRWPDLTDVEYYVEDRELARAARTRTEPRAAERLVFVHRMALRAGGGLTAAALVVGVLWARPEQGLDRELANGLFSDSTRVPPSGVVIVEHAARGEAVAAPSAGPDSPIAGLPPATAPASPSDRGTPSVVAGEPAPLPAPSADAGPSLARTTVQAPRLPDPAPAPAPVVYSGPTRPNADREAPDPVLSSDPPPSSPAEQPPGPADAGPAPDGEGGQAGSEEPEPEPLVDGELAGQEVEVTPPSEDGTSSGEVTVGPVSAEVPPVIP